MILVLVKNKLRIKNIMVTIKPNINPFRYPFEVLVFPKIYPDMNIIIRYMINITIVLVFNPMRFKMLKIKGNIINNVIGLFLGKSIYPLTKFFLCFRYNFEIF